MSKWKIRVLLYGYLTGMKGDFDGGLDPDLLIQLPYLGFLLKNGRENVLVDTGINDAFLSKLHLSDIPPVGGRLFVMNELKNAGLTPDDIQTVIYTHLHNDHAGNADLFPNAKTYIQKDEYDNLCHPWPEHQVRLDYDVTAVERLEKVKNIEFIDGDIVLENGLELYKIPGHTAGHQAVVVPTEKGKYVLCGDLPHMACALFPWMERMALLDGTEINITPNKNVTYLFNSFSYDLGSADQSYQKLMTLGEAFKPEYYLCSHEPECVMRKYYG